MLAVISGRWQRVVVVVGRWVAVGGDEWRKREYKRVALEKRCAYGMYCVILDLIKMRRRRLNENSEGAVLHDGGSALNSLQPR